MCVPRGLSPLCPQIPHDSNCHHKRESARCKSLKQCMFCHSSLPLSFSLVATIGHQRYCSSAGSTFEKVFSAGLLPAYSPHIALLSVCILGLLSWPAYRPAPPHYTVPLSVEQVPLGCLLVSP